MKLLKICGIFFSAISTASTCSLHPIWQNTASMINQTQKLGKISKYMQTCTNCDICFNFTEIKETVLYLLRISFRGQRIR